ncbi:MAG: hypothetical protein ACKO8H_11675, partial [Microcystis panniformis]
SNGKIPLPSLVMVMRSRSLRCTISSILLRQMTQITIDLPVSLVESAQCLGKATARELSEVLIDTLEIILPTFNNLSIIGNQTKVSHLLDSEVIELANLKIEAVQNQRLGELQAKGKNTGLTEAEGYELLVLISIYQMGQLRKSMALAEAVKRGLK